MLAATSGAAANVGVNTVERPPAPPSIKIWADFWGFCGRDDLTLYYGGAAKPPAHIFMESGAGGRSTVLTPTLAAAPLTALANCGNKLWDKEAN